MSAWLQGADLQGANVQGADLNAHLDGPDVDGDDLQGLSSGGITGTPSALPAHWQLTDGYLIGPGVSLDGADLEGADLEGGDLEGGELNFADLEDAVLEGANLEGATLSKRTWTACNGAIPPAPIAATATKTGAPAKDTSSRGRAAPQAGSQSRAPRRLWFPAHLVRLNPQLSQMLAPEKRLRAELASTRVSGSSDIIFVLGFVSWSGAAARGFTFPEDRFASSLLSHARARRVLVCDPPRSALRRLARAMLRAHDSQFPTGSLVAHHAPLRLRSEDPGHPEAMSRAYAAYERGIRRVALQRGLEHPAVVTANPLLAGFGDFSWAGPVTYYAWDDWAASPPLRRWWPSYSDAFARVREKQRRVVAVSTAIIDRIAPTAAHAVVPNGVDACGGSAFRRRLPGLHDVPRRDCCTWAAWNRASTPSSSVAWPPPSHPDRSRSSGHCSTRPTSRRSGTYRTS